MPKNSDIAFDVEALKKWLDEQYEKTLEEGRRSAELVKSWIGEGQPGIVDSELAKSRMCAARAAAFRTCHHRVLEIEHRIGCRSLLRVTALHEVGWKGALPVPGLWADFLIPGWDPHTPVTLAVPAWLYPTLQVGSRVHAQVDLNADTAEDLRPRAWEKS